MAKIDKLDMGLRNDDIINPDTQYFRNRGRTNSKCPTCGNYGDYKRIELLTEMKEIIEGNVSDKWMNIKDVCDYSSVFESTIRRAVRKGSLKASQSTGKLLFKVSSVDRWLNG